MKTVLVVSFFYPPFDTTAAVEASKLTRYLPEWGWTPVVLAAARSGFAPTLPVEVPDEAVHRTWSLDVNRLPKALTAGRRGAYVGYVPTGPSLAGRTAARLAAAWRQLVNVPDGQVGWLPFAVRRGEQLLREHGIDLVFSMAGPFTSHLVASRLARASGTPWVADFRDLWNDSHQFRRVRPLRPIERRLEQRTLEAAGALTTATPAWASLLERRHGKPAWVIHNGFDPVDLPTPGPPASRFTLTYTGVLYQDAQDIGSLLRAIALLREEGALDASSFELRLVGRYLRAVRPDVRRLQIDDLVSFTDTVSHGEALRLQADATALVLLLWTRPEGRGWLSAKRYEYMASGRPILAVGPRDCDAAQVVAEMRAGVVASDAATVAAIIRSWLAEFERTGRVASAVDREALRVYEWRAVTGRLAAAFDATVGSEPAAAADLPGGLLPNARNRVDDASP